MNTPAVSRRALLGMVGLGALAAAGCASAAGNSAGTSAAGSSAGSAAVPDLTLDPPADDGFTIFTVTSGYPEMSTADYRLHVTGLVGKELDLSFADLAALPQTSLTKDFQCVTGWRVPDVPWSGVLLSDVLTAAQAQATAPAVSFHSFDGAYTESLTREQSLRPDVLVATSMFGRPITREHGGPVRMLVAPMYGYKSIKWLDRIEVVDRVIPGYWEDLGYDVDAWVGSSNGRDDPPVV